MNTPVSFPIAKLLKEKGYKDKNVLGIVRLSEPKYYDPNGIIHGIKDAFEENDYKIEDCFNAPTIAEVVMWLYEKHGIWIGVHSTRGYFVGNWIIHNTPRGGDTDVFNSPTEAYEAAIEYALKNLLQ